jgi:RNA polymerase sigma-70 factor (ECF subfamily)
VSDLDVHLSAIVAGDVAAFSLWLSAAEKPLRLSLRSFAQTVDVEAVVQEALLRAWQVAPRVTLDGKPNALLRLTLHMARNLAVSELRRRRATDPLEEAEQALGLEALEAMAHVPDPLLRKTIALCRSLLPDKPREALAARLASAGRELDAAVAATLQMRVNTFLQNITRARKLLAECLKSKGVELSGGQP